MKRTEIIIRDPFIIRDGSAWLMTGTMGMRDGKPGFFAYETRDFETFGGPLRIFTPPEGFWGTCDYWAPEIHAYHDRYYLFASFRSEERYRGSQIFSADTPRGPFLPHSEGPITPYTWPCLDATLYIDENGDPWTVYVREFLQTIDGEMYAQRLSPDLRRVASDPVRLFTATQAPWCVPNAEGGFPMDVTGYITDAPWLFHLSTGTLGMLWSSFCAQGYCQAVCYSTSGRITGPWVQEEAPLYCNDSGHGMIFEGDKGEWVLPLHDCNHNGPHPSNPVFLRVAEQDGKLAVV